MSKITFSLVGGQPFPVYAQALDSKPDILVLFYSKQTERYALNVERCLKQKLPHLVVQQVETDANDLKKSYRTFAANANVWLKPENEITVNLSGGTKPWSMQLLNIFGGKENAKCVFIDQNNKIWDMATLTSHTFAHTEISLDDKFALYGVKSIQRTNINDYDDQDFIAIRQIEKLYQFNRNALREITTKINDDDKQGIKSGLYTKAGCSVERVGENEFHCTFEHHRSHDITTQLVSSPNACRLMLNTGWFELKVAEIISHWPSAGQVWTNTSINYYNNPNTVNEIDIIVETNQDKLLFVECKTHVHDSTDIDKFNDVTKSYVGLGGKRIFVTYNPMTGLPNDKCEVLEIPRFSTLSIRNGTQVFYDSLDKYMDTINAR